MRGRLIQESLKGREIKRQWEMRINWKKVRKDRNPEKVRGIPDLKAKYCKEQEKLKRWEYLREKEKTE